jgi:endonuclease/exonuclease/phosphatase family metal-dependent hydrolase
MIHRWEQRWRKFRRWISRNEWSVRWLRLPRSEATANEAGLLIIQIDGLSRRQFERALRKRRMPFLRRLIRRDHYRIRTFYSGIPSSTPAVQAEIFYGVKCAVPAFAFFQDGSLKRMFEAEPAAAREAQLKQQSEGLLSGGSAYADIYGGGAAEPHFCAATAGWQGFLKSLNPLTLPGIVLWHGWSVVQMLMLGIAEFWIAAYDVLTGARDLRQLFKEIKFIASRVAVSVLLREFAAIGASIDVTRGLPVVHVNFLGYDEHAHRRGPASRFAHWSLKGIDDAIRGIVTAARRSERRHYDVWIYSDHGQERTVPYEFESGRTLHEAVAEVFGQPEFRSRPRRHKAEPRSSAQRSAWLGTGKLTRWIFGAERSDEELEPEPVKIAALGPVGLLYPTHPLDNASRARLAMALVQQAKIPVVLIATQPGRAKAWTAQGVFELPEQAGAVVGYRHPFLEEVARDLVELCHHPDAGEYVLLGWRPEGRPLSFPVENGAHAGPGYEETRGFALLPADAPIRRQGRRYLRGLDLREAALHVLGRSPLSETARPARPLRLRNTLRVMTYNVHSCIGMDGRLSTSRIARIIAQCRPDIVALQELDVGRGRTGGVDQAHAIAEELEMEFHFFPAVRLEEELYGDAILSRWPMRLIKAGPLPTLVSRWDLEPRGALWVSVSIEGQELQLLNTHLGLLSKERMLQAQALLGDEWLGHPDCRGSVILCGDFNAIPASSAYRLLRSRLQDAQLALNGHRPKRTFFSRYPVNRIDHIFVGQGVQVLDINVPRDHLTCMASDHLPLVADVCCSQLAQAVDGEVEEISPARGAMIRS